MRLIDNLVAMGAIDEDYARNFRDSNPDAANDEAVYDLLLSESDVGEDILIEALAALHGLGCRSALSDEALDPALVEKVPIAWAREHCVLPIRCDDQIAMLAANADCADEEEYLSLILDREIYPILAPEDLVRQSIERCYVSRDGSSSQIIEDMQTEDQSKATASRQSDIDLLSSVEGAPVTQLANMILLEAVKRDASDIHIEPYEDRIQIRYRIDGVLYDQPAPPKHLQQALISRLKVMAKLDIAEKRLPQDGMAKVRVGEREVDMRVSTVPVAEGERIVLRILRRQSVLMPLDSLGMSNRLLKVFNTLLAEPQGIILVTGPTGSGKTTTLYAGLQELDTRHLNVITIEDPIEYQLEGISQIQVKPRIGLTFADGLRHILRQDPDVVLVGEIRDTETAEIAVRSSLTGHLVLSTLHTNDAVSTPLRIIDMGIKPYLLSESLRAVMAQRLVRRLCPQCKASAVWTEEEIARVGQRTSPPEKGARHWTATGCDACRDGYRGRIGIFEYLLVKDEVKSAIRMESRQEELQRLADQYAMDNFWQDGLRKISAGTTSLAEIQRVLGRTR